MYWQESASNDKMDKYIEEYKKFQAQADSASRFADSLKVYIVIAENEARAAESRAQVLQVQAVELKSQTQDLRQRATELSETITDTLELARILLPIKDSIIEVQDSTIKTQDNQISELQSALHSKDRAILLLTTSRDSLQIMINLIPAPPKNPNRLLGFKLPSRKSSFLIGAAIGVGAGLLVIK